MRIEDMVTFMWKNFYHHYQKLFFGVIVSLIIYRSPDLFFYPRFWAEEGTLYFKSIYENSWLDGLLFIPRYTAEYLALGVNLPLTVAAHLTPLEYATAISTYFSLFILLIPFCIILWGNSHIWNTPLKKFFACAIILLAPTSTDAEIWLNTINLQVYGGIIALCILLEQVEVLTSWRRWAYRILLIFCGLSGPYTMFLTPVFLLKAWYERKREAFWHLGIVASAAMVQASLFVMIKHLDLVSPSKLSHFDLFKAPIYIFNYHIMTPLLGLWVRLGANIEDVMRTSKLHGVSLLTVSLIISITIGIILYLLAKNRTSFYRIILVVSFLLVSSLTAYGSMNGIPFGRYAVIPGILFLLLLLDNVPSQGFKLEFKPLFFMTLVCLALVMGFKTFRDRIYWMEYGEGAPKWAEEIRHWQQQPDSLIKSWPYPWADESWKFYLSHRELMSTFQATIRNNPTIQLSAQAGEVAEKTIAVEGLPIDFHLIFVAHVIGDLATYEADILFFGSNNESYGSYSIRQGLNQQPIAILDFYSVDRRTLPHTKMLTAFQAVTKIVFRLKSSSSHSLTLSDLKVVPQQMSVF